MAYRFIDERDEKAWVKSARRGHIGLAARIYRSSTQRVMSLTFVGLALGFLVDVLIAAKLGTGQTADALVIALTLPILIDTVCRQGTRHSMVPLFIEANSSLGEEEFQRFVSGLLNLGCVLGVIVVGILEALAPWIVMGLAPGLTPESKAESTLLLRLCAPLIFFTIGCTVMGVYLNSRRRFNPVALRNVLTPGVILCVTLFSWRSEHLATWVAAAYTLGFAGFFFTLFMDLRRAGHRHIWLAWTTREDSVASEKCSLPSHHGHPLEELPTHPGTVSCLAGGGGRDIFVLLCLPSYFGAPDADRGEYYDDSLARHDRARYTGS